MLLHTGHFSLLCYILLCKYKVNLSVLLLRDIWGVISNHAPVNILICMSFGRPRHSFLLRIYLGVKFLGH